MIEQALLPAPATHHELLELVARAQRGSAAARDALFAQLRPRLQGPVRRLVAGSPLDAEDALQDVLLKVFLALPSFDIARGVRFTTWTHVIATNHCRQLRRQSRIRQAALATAAPEPPGGATPFSEHATDHAAYRELELRLRSAVQRLSAPHLEVLQLRFEHQMSYAAIGRRLGVSRATVKSRLCRARTVLRRLLSARERRVA